MDGADDTGRLLTHWPAMVGVCERVLSSRAEAEDCASEALLAVLERGGLDRVENEEAWLVRIAQRRAIDAVRRDIRGRRRAVRLAAETGPHAAADVAEAVVEQAEARWLSRLAEQTLPARTAQVLAAVADGHSVADAADQLGMTKRAAESHLHRARTALRSAWGATLGLLAGVLWTVRRVAHGAPVAVLAAAAAVLMAPHLLTPQTAPASVTPQPAYSTQTVAVPAPAASPARPRVQITRRSPATRRPAPQGRSVTQVRTRAGAVVVERQHRPSPGDVVGGVLWCARHTVVTTDHVGC